MTKPKTDQAEQCGELKACPFCGVTGEKLDNAPVVWMLHTKECFFHPCLMTIKEQVAWNTRLYPCLQECRVERDELKGRIKQIHIDLGHEVRDPNGTIWQEAERLQEQRDEARATIVTMQKQQCADCVTIGELHKIVEALRLIAASWCARVESPEGRPAQDPDAVLGFVIEIAEQAIADFDSHHDNPESETK